MSLDQWTPATVAAAQANRPRRYGLSGGMGANALDATGLGFLYRYQLQMYSGPSATDTMGDYLSGVVDRGNALGLDRFGRAVQTLRQAVARIVRRAKWRRIIRALRLRARDGHGLHTRTVLYQGRPGPSMWPQVRRNPNWNPGLRGTGTRGHFYANPNPNP